MWAPSLSWEDPLEEETTTHSNILAWEIPWTKEPGGLQLMGLQRVGHDSVTQHAHTHNHLLGFCFQNLKGQLLKRNTAMFSVIV